MVVYEVRCVVEQEVAEAFEAWLGPHVREVCACDGFEGAECVRVSDPVSPGRVVFSTRYRVRDRGALDAYLEGPAAALREDGMRRFGGRFEATRQIGPVVVRV